MSLNPDRLQGTTQYSLEVFPTGNRPPQELRMHYSRMNAQIRADQAMYEPYWKNHIDQSKAKILDTASGLGGEALILGFGNGMDIPIAELAQQFDKVTIVEMDFDSVHQSLLKLPSALQSKIHVIIEDLSGTAVAFGEEVAKLQPGSIQPADYYTKVAEVVKNLQPAPYAPGKEYSFVCSSLVMSQLVGVIHEYSVVDGYQRFGVPRYDPAVHGTEYAKETSDLSFKEMEEHIGVLARSVAKNGKVYFADTQAEAPFVRDPVTQQVTPGGQRQDMIDMTFLGAWIYNYFTPQNQENWIWYRNVPDQAVIMPTYGSAFNIYATELVPKP